MNLFDIEATLKDESVDTLLLMSVFGEDAFRHHARKALQKRQLICCPEDFGDDFITNVELIF